MLGEEGSSCTKYQVYSSRWILLLAVTLLNLANYSHWVAFASVAKKAAEYYQVSGPEVTWGSTLWMQIKLYFGKKFSLAGVTQMR